jgi:hypothetical protein
MGIIRYESKHVSKTNNLTDSYTRLQGQQSQMCITPKAPTRNTVGSESWADKATRLSKQADPNLYLREPVNPIFESEQLRVISACFLCL